jgi:hypothetical protein
MPELPIVDSEGKLLPYAPFIVLAYTIYPDGDDKFEELLASGMVHDVIRESPEDDHSEELLQLATNNPWLIPALFRGPTPERILKDANQADASAWAAGEILLMMLCASTFHPEIDLTLKMTIEVISEFQREGGRVAASESTLWNSWSKFKSVAHFHAVRQAWASSVDRPSYEHFIAWRIESFDEYLACAENYRKHAVAKRFVAYDESWRAPSSLLLPPANLELGPLTPELLKIFLRYHAP